MTIQSYRDLKAWQESMNLVEMCYSLTKEFPKEELFGLTSQIRRASTSIPANIAEGYGRKGRNEYIHFLYIAQGSLKELETHLLISVRVGIIDNEKIKMLIIKSDEVARILYGLIKSLENKT